MSDKPLLLVAGLGRCGSSLVMQMLDAGGINCHGPYPAFEHNAAIDKFNPLWDQDIGGTAIKVLDGFRYCLPLRYRNTITIWLDRDNHQQACSMAKFMELEARYGKERMPEIIARIEQSLVEDRKPAMKSVYAFEGAGQRPTLCMKFDDIIADPLKAAQAIGDFLIDNKMLDIFGVWEAQQVVRDRSPECLDGMMEFDLLGQRDAH